MAAWTSHYSFRKTVTGSTRWARRAGPHTATSVTPRTNAASAPYVAGSDGVTSYSILDAKRASA